ncbi:MAG: hypothetical protein PHP04_11855 [Bacteroidales bacterium]|nr:hypothetical protein [Bacteroidales bacterium]
MKTEKVRQTNRCYFQHGLVVVKDRFHGRAMNARDEHEMGRPVWLLYPRPEQANRCQRQE